MKVAFIALTSLCMAVSEGSDPIKCWQSDGEGVTEKVCSGDKATAKKCSQPRFLEYTGLSSNVPYSCGPCPVSTTHTCEECYGSVEAGCNKAKDTGEDFQCYDYELKEGKFVQKETPTTCKRLKSTEKIKCNMPGDAADVKYTMKKSGCGGCPYRDKAAYRCAECVGDKCNKTPIKCIQGDGTDLRAKICVPADNAESLHAQCHRPKFIEYTGFPKDQEYGCGACGSGAEGKCETCTGNTATACNTKIGNLGRDFHCYTYEYKDGTFAKKTEVKDRRSCKRLATTPIKCNRPGAKAEQAEADKYKANNETYCGPCAEDQKTQGKCEEASPVPIKCLSGGAGDFVRKTCSVELGETVIEKCHQTKFIQYFGLAGDLKYGCGPCPSGSETTCQECYGNEDKSCNAVIETNEDYSCYDYEYKEDKFVAKNTMMTCKRKKHTAPKCNMPGKNATESTYSNKGCGGCTEAEMKAVTCTECGNVECNKAYAVTFTTLILPVILAFMFE